MAQTQAMKLSYLKKVFYQTHIAGLGAGIMFPFVALLLIGEPAKSPLFVIASLFMGFSLAAAMFLLMRATLKKQLRDQLEQLRPLAGNIAVSEESVEGMNQAVENAVSQVGALVNNLLGTIDKLFPQYRSLAESSRYLADRAQEGISAAQKTRGDMEAMAEKQRGVMAQVQALFDRAQGEASWSRELSASLEEMAKAMEHSTTKFLETTSSVEEMAASVQEVASQAEQVARGVEGSVRDLDVIDESFESIRNGAVTSAQSADAVKKDAEDGLRVVETTMQEMERIEQESHKATQAMKRLSTQTSEVVKIIEVIKELVSDTELLAFNAAIIAAKAGAEGKGFSVVAEEIRDLADRTTTSAQDIHRIVKAIASDTAEVMDAVDATSERIARGKQHSVSAGEALRKILESSSQAANASDQIARLTGDQSERARSLLESAGRNMRSVKVIARTLQEQQTAVARTQEGVSQMKYASDQIARSMAEQVRANRDFDKGLAEREKQVQTINEATRFQMETADKVFAHFANSERRLQKNAEKSASIMDNIHELEHLSERLRDLAGTFDDLNSGEREIKYMDF
ncbi:methyl-accepting chemotaxis protein [Desulfuromonas versatilis]|uniref:Methyl-accepting chemotaxis protein n=1 Tax=Desulfuromonas versatilis TaxID=2802975 RepID=A0ABM8HS37_9BACT|nr:methyl-accepting chemotaxis protein [Desulfuromonas versatilis]BCR03272.1 methyl-accepting chemotaxis protein [Desulfuromonas versatilis]